MQTLYIHPDNPQDRLTRQVAQSLTSDKLIMLPTDLGYVFAITLSAKNAQKTTQQLCSDECHWVLVCRDLSQIATYANMDDGQFRTIKAHHGTPAIFVLPATKATPKQLTHPKHKTIGTLIATTPISLALLDTLGEPFAICCPADTIHEPYMADERFGHQLDILVDIGTLDNPDIPLINLSAE
ncbi:MAG: Sua5/YciO/YrdC/YwlC family protein [Moraxella sp.]|nr:Sua5/YciO/YrdC/YwlC family protein [Moraxella sp.]